MDPITKAMLKDALEDAFKDSVGDVFKVMLENVVTDSMASASDRAKLGFKNRIDVYNTSLAILNQMDAVEEKSKRK
jgi:hypothetical protein